MDNVVVVDEQDNELAIMTRAQAHEKGLLHRVACVYVVDGAGKTLVQVRMNGLLDHSSAGHVDPGESYEVAAARELSEELGISGVLLKEFGTAISDERNANGPTRLRHYFEMFVCQAVPGTLQPEEVRAVYWADPREVLEDMKKDPNEEKYAGGFMVTLKKFLERQL